MNYFNLYRMGRYGWYHVTSHKFNNLMDAICYYKKEWSVKIGNELANYKVTGL